MTKKLLSGILAIVLSLTFFPMLITETQAASSGYSSKKALSFANKNWNSGKGLCAEFVADCLKAGGVDNVYETTVVNLYNALLENKWGKSVPLKLTTGRTGYLMESDNASKVKKGDPLFYYCKNCDKYSHAVISNGFNSEGYHVDYAHNRAHNGKNKTCTYSHRDCGRRNWTIYAINMSNQNVLFGEKTSVNAPELKKAANTDDGVKINWSKVKGADSYRVYRKTQNSSWTNLGSHKTTSFTDTKAQNGVEYTYTVKACKGKKVSQYYGGISVLALDAPEFTSISTDGKAITVKWSENKNADGYYLYRKVNNGSWKRYKTIAGSENALYTDTAVQQGDIYSYRILAFADGVLSGYDFGGVRGKVISAPKIKSLTNAVDGMKITWSGSKGATHYSVYRRSEDNKSWVLLGKVKGSSFTDDTAQSGKTYRYTVRSESDLNRGTFNKSGVKKLFLDTPTLAAVSSNDSVTLTWDKIKGAKGYRLYQKDEDSSEWTRISTVKNVDEYVVDDVEGNEDCTYTIKAYNGKITSSYVKDGVKAVYGLRFATETTEAIQ